MIVYIRKLKIQFFDLYLKDEIYCHWNSKTKSIDKYQCLSYEFQFKKIFIPDLPRTKLWKQIVRQIANETQEHDESG